MINHSPEPDPSSEKLNSLWSEFNTECSRVIFPACSLDIGLNIQLTLRREGTNSDVHIIADASELARRANGSFSERFTCFGLCTIDKSTLSFSSDQLSLGWDGGGVPLLAYLQPESYGVRYSRFFNLLPLLEEHSLDIPVLSMLSSYRSVECSLRQVHNCLKELGCSPFEVSCGELVRLLRKDQMDVLAIEEGIELTRYIWLRGTIFSLLSD